MGVLQNITGIFMKLLQLRTFIIFSLILQSTLIILSPLRKKVSSPVITTFLWIEYTVATLAAVYAVGLVTTASLPGTHPATHRDLISLWSPFISLQVVGPDTVTAFSFEDTNSWLRTSLRLLLTVVAVNRAMIVLYPRSRLVVAAVFVCFASVNKFYETVHCLFVGNLTRFRTFTKPIHYPRDDDPGLNLPHGSGHKLRDADVARDAFGFFQTFKGIFANVVFSPRERGLSRDYFLARDAEDAFAVVETELNFAYDILYTKKLVLTWRLGRIVRFVTVLLELVAFLIWVSAHKGGFEEVDIRITYTLFVFAMAFETAYFLIHLLSNWTIASVLLKRSSEKESFWVKCISLKKKFGLLSRRWSGSVSRYSLILWCTSKSSPKVDKVLGCLKIKDFVYGFRNMSPTRSDDKLRDLIFNELKYRSLKAEHQQVSKQMSSFRGDWILREYYHDNPLVLRFANSWFPESMEYGKIVLIWHVATELCYYSYSTSDHEEKERSELNKVISDYMTYLLVREQTMLSEVAGEAKATFQHTCKEVVKMLSVREMEGLKDKEEKVRKACRMIVSNRDHDDEVENSDDGMKNSVLQDAQKLSDELKGLKDRGINMWEVMSKVWVELLCYAAWKCKPSEHAAQLCKGGQLLTIVWLLTAHLGLSNRFDHPN